MFDPESNVVIIDDSSIMRSQVRRVFNQLGFRRVFEGSNGKEGIMLVKYLLTRGVKPSVIVTDKQMPEMDGIEMILFLRNLDNFRYTPILLQSSDVKQEDLDKVLPYRFFEFIRKPISENQLIDKLEKLHQEVLNHKV